MIEARDHAFRGGWIIREVPGGPHNGWTRSATREGRELRQGAMDYHAFIVAMERIAGIPCFGDFIEGIQQGLDKDGAWAQAVYTPEEAWSRAEAQAEGVQWDRQAFHSAAINQAIAEVIRTTLEAPPVILPAELVFEVPMAPSYIEIVIPIEPAPGLCPVDELPWDPEPAPAPAPPALPAPAPPEDFIQAALARMRARKEAPAPAPTPELPRPLPVAQAFQPSLFGEEL